MKIIKSLLSIVLVVLLVSTLFVGCRKTDTPTTTKETTTEVVTEEVTEYNPDKKVTVPEEVKDLVEDTDDTVDNGESVETSDVAKSTPKEESTLEDELEVDGVVEQENISYNGTNTGKGKNLLSGSPKLTYYSQMDPRWASTLYTSTGSKTQTMKSSGCGPTSAAMVISSSKGIILPPTVAKLFVSNGYRTANNGTAWSAWSFVADYFNFKSYHTTSSFSTMTSYLKQDKNKDGEADYFVVVSCGSGLFTTGGHYIVLVADKSGTITVYDPYYYVGKFDTPSRRAAGVKTSGNSAYVSEASFKKYGNAQQYWIYSNDSETKKKEDSSKKDTKVTYKTTVGKTYQLKQQSNLYSKGNLTGTEYTYVKGAQFKVLKHYNTKVDYVQSTKTGRKAYINVNYLTTINTVSYKSVVGHLYRLKSYTTLYSNSNLTGNQYQYYAQTQVKVIKHASTTVDYIYVVKTGRYAYCKVSAFI